MSHLGSAWLIAETESTRHQDKESRLGSVLQPSLILRLARTIAYAHGSVRHRTKNCLANGKLGAKHRDMGVLSE